MIPKKPAPGHSRPKDGVASLAYDPGSRVYPTSGVLYFGTRASPSSGGGNRFLAFAKPASAGEGRSEKIMLKQEARAKI
jgi:hypothetical protein